MYRGSEDTRAQQTELTGAPGGLATDEAETWARVKRRLRAELGEEVFTSWFGRLELEAIAEGCAYLTVPTRFLKSWIEANYGDRVLSVYRTETPAMKSISIGVRSSLGRDPAATPKRASEAPRSNPTPRPRPPP